MLSKCILTAALAAAYIGSGLRVASAEVELVNCRQVATTGYIRGDHSDYTADGTSVWSYEPLVAVSPSAERWYPLGSVVHVEGVGLATVRDRTAQWVDWPLVDVLVNTRDEARWINAPSRANPDGRWVCQVGN